MGIQIPSKANYHGRNAEYESDDFVRCSRCGFPCRLDRDIQGSEGSKVGLGITNKLINNYDSSDTLYDPIVTSGCPQCGTLLYNK